MCAERKRDLPPVLLTVLYLPVLVLVTPLALALMGWTGRKEVLWLVPAAIVAAYIWVIPRVRRLS
jgi:hypothetical protein